MFVIKDFDPLKLLCILKAEFKILLLFLSFLSLYYLLRAALLARDKANIPNEVSP